MDLPIMALDIYNEMDVMLAHRRGLQFAKFLGISLAEQTRFATAISEICRNCVEHAGQGAIHYSVLKDRDSWMLLAAITDKGKGITGLAEILQRKAPNRRGRGLGIVRAKRLADDFRITSNPAGTTVILQKTIPSKNIVVDKLVVQGWVRHLQEEGPISAYEEAKIRNAEAIQLIEELKAKTELAESQMKEITKLNEKLSFSNARLKEFTFAISHDLKTPLSTLRIASEYLLQNPKEEEIPTYLQILSRSVWRLDKTIHGLIEILDMQDHDKLIIRPIDLEQLLAEVMEEYQQLIKEAAMDIRIDFSAAPGISYVEAYIKSLFSNLLSNSLKYRDPGRAITVTITTEKVAEGVRLTWSDTGSGMDLQMVQNRIFQPFVRFSNGTEGKGIGLYLIKGMVENNGGTVVVDSALSKGTTFTFLLVPYT